MAEQELFGQELGALSFGATVTIFFSDIRGFTEYTDRFGDEAAYNMLQHHNLRVQEQIALYGGHIVKTLGDSYMVSFDAARTAVACAVAVQRALESYNNAEESTKIQIGIGINTGEPVRTATDLFGGAVNLAARICAAAGPGEVLVSETVRHVVGRAEGMEWADRGMFELKGFGEPQHLFGVEWSGVGDAQVMPAPPQAARPAAALATRSAAPSAVAQGRAPAWAKPVALVGAVAALAAAMLFGARIFQQAGVLDAPDASALNGEQAPPSEKLLRSDDFSDPSRGLFLNNQRGTVRRPLRDGSGGVLTAPFEYAYKDGALVVRVNGPYPQNSEGALLGPGIEASDSLLDDFAVEFGVRAVKSARQANFAISYAVRRPESATPKLYMFQVFLESQLGNLMVSEAGPPVRVANGRHSALKSGTEENRIRVEVRNDVMHAFVNGTQVLRSQMDGLSQRGGVLTLTASMSGPLDEDELEVRFDDFKVFSLGS